LHGEIVIVGGGAGGLELACKLGRKLGPQRVLLVDSRLFHIWKPSLHEVAAGRRKAGGESQGQTLGPDPGSAPPGGSGAAGVFGRITVSMVPRCGAAPSVRLPPR
jgi:hypothetical protein